MSENEKERSESSQKLSSLILKQEIGIEKTSSMNFTFYFFLFRLFLFKRKKIINYRSTNIFSTYVLLSEICAVFYQNFHSSFALFITYSIFTLHLMNKNKILIEVNPELFSLIQKQKQSNKKLLWKKKKCLLVVIVGAVHLVKPKIKVTSSAIVLAFVNPVTIVNTWVAMLSRKCLVKII